MKPGDRVMINRQTKRRWQWERIRYGNGTIGKFSMRDHSREFRRCVGIVLSTPVEDPEYIDVRWQPSGLRYLYNRKELRLALP